MLILSLDGSLSRTGYCIYDTEIKEFVEIGSIPTSSTKPLAYRLKQIYDKICLLCVCYKFEEVVIEEPIVNIKRIKSTMQVHKALGIIHLALLEFKINEIHNKTVKKYVTGNGNAKKNDVMQSIISKFPELQYKIKNDDESDAVGVLLTYLQLLEV